MKNGTRASAAQLNEEEQCARESSAQLREQSSSTQSLRPGVGSSNYTSVWAMAGENPSFDDMDAVPISEMRENQAELNM
ncbi:hypothetical protein [Microbacterium sp. MPKO10]|uniref:hypothetical protein n=1 Tax=Microbacterium sp. MPKO10 TaxID=2989818 RepID=UPI0022368A43|nr:hypothetical protein [Microbacterium sp. MPKO10]MCW4457033.1 hypothetical protein [Microbacterium sp. MPKO10]